MMVITLKNNFRGFISVHTQSLDGGSNAYTKVRLFVEIMGLLQIVRFGSLVFLT